MTTEHDDLIAEARKEVRSMMGSGWHVERALFIRLIAALEVARADGERLDWLDSDDNPLVPDRYAEREFRYPEPAVWHVAHRNDRSWTAPTLRAAIDQARGKTT